MNIKVLCTDLLFYLCVVNKQELKMEDCERQLTTNMLNVVAALAMRSVRNTGIFRNMFSVIMSCCFGYGHRHVYV